MFRPPLRIACHYAIGLAITTLVIHTWFVMGLLVPVVVSGNSMAPTMGTEAGGLQTTGRVFVDRTAYLFRRPAPWDVVVFRCPHLATEFWVKRIVGMPGETVSLEAGKVFINGQSVGNPPGETAEAKSRSIYYGVRLGDRPQLVDGRKVSEIPWPNVDGPGRAASWQLGPNEYFVIGDNAAVSDDSRNWVPKAGLDAKLLLGKPLGVR